jgi:DNA-binding MarR family transcriptional regulator
MHITISPTGEIHMDTNGSSPAEVAGTILSIQRELRQQAEAEAAKAATSGNAIPLTLNDCQSQTYDWLVSNDVDSGIHISAVARQFGISKDAASNRLQRLSEMGFARRVGGGKYRAVTE